MRDLNSLRAANSLIEAHQFVMGTNRLILTSDIHVLVDDIKIIENGQLGMAAPTYQLLKYNADRAFIIAGVINILLLLVAFSLIKKSF